jgi:hypothetical protein
VSEVVCRRSKDLRELLPDALSDTRGVEHTALETLVLPLQARSPLNVDPKRSGKSVDYLIHPQAGTTTQLKQRRLFAQPGREQRCVLWSRL